MRHVHQELGWPGDAAMTAWFKRTQPDAPKVAQDLTEPGLETPAAIWGRLEDELQPDCVCGEPAELIVLMHNLDHCQGGPMVGFFCPGCVRDVHRFVDNTLDVVHKFDRWACKTCGAPVAAPHDLTEDVVKL